jgi:hypothetical protein
VPSRKTLLTLKECEVTPDPIDIGIWFPFGNIHQAFASDFPITNFPFTLGDPTFWTLRSALLLSKNGSIPSRKRGKSPQYLLGGMHMSHYGYLPFRLVNAVTATEGGIIDIQGFKRISEKLMMGKVLELEKELAQVPPGPAAKIISTDPASFKDVKVTKKKIEFLPWFYDCNRLRYPAWEGIHDSRID